MIDDRESRSLSSLGIESYVSNERRELVSSSACNAERPVT